jgi:4-alpha-glucanotransferase
MPPFTAFWRGMDIDDRRELGLLSEREAEREHAGRARLRAAIGRELSRRTLVAQGEIEAREIVRALLVLLGRSRARVVLTNLEDLWGETRPQNVPGTAEERPNWRRKARYTLEEMQTLGELAQTLSALHSARRKVRP